ncbi:MAG: glycosyltransferase family 2 protein [Betaproteobacteria bacterium]
MPTYNGEAFLDAAVASALGQSYANIELLIIDDASTDNTAELARSIALRDHRVRFISNERNLGLVTNWNRCLLEARGKWIKFLFQDDILELRCIEELVAAAESGNASFVACFRDFIFEGEVAQDLRSRYQDQAATLDAWYQSPTKSPAQFAALALAQPPRNLVGEPTVTMFKRELVWEIGLFDPALIHLCDAEYWLRLGTLAGLLMVRKKLARFRVHGKSTSSANASERLFRANSLDPLIMLFKELYARDYSIFRQSAEGAFDATGRAAEFWALCHHAKAHAQDAHSNGDDGPLKEWKAVCAQFPLFDRVPIHEAARRKLRRLAALLAGPR